MNSIIPHDILLKIKESQDQTLNRVKAEASTEIHLIGEKFIAELKNNLDSILSDPFNIYLKIPRISTNNSKLYLSELRKKYAIEFHHELQLSNSPDGSYFYILLKHERITCEGDPRPQQLMLDAAAPSVEEQEDDRKKFDAIEAGRARSTLRSGMFEKKDMDGILQPLFLQRRNSKLSLPTISARRAREQISVSDNPEASECESESGAPVKQAPVKQAPASSMQAD